MMRWRRRCIQPGLAAALATTLVASVGCQPTGEGYCFSDGWDSADEGVVFIKQGVADPRESLHCWCADQGTRNPADFECSPVGDTCLHYVCALDFPESEGLLVRVRHSDNAYKLTSADLEEIRAACESDTGDSGAAP